MKSAPFAAPLLAALTLTLSACHAPGQTAGNVASAAQTATARPSTVQPRSAPAPLPSRDPASGLAFAPLGTLPVQAQQTYRLILGGGPFPYRRDGVVYQNRERVLPRRAGGGYHEYTVTTPGSADRGARRIVCAGDTRSLGSECYYTADHYASFRRIRP